MRSGFRREHQPLVTCGFRPAPRSAPDDNGPGTSSRESRLTAATAVRAVVHSGNGDRSCRGVPRRAVRLARTVLVPTLEGIWLVYVKLCLYLPEVVAPGRG
jgi:hypothetical protein